MLISWTSVISIGARWGGPTRVKTAPSPRPTSFYKINGIQDRLSFSVQLNGRRIRQRKVAAADIKPYHVRPEELRLAFEDEYAHVAWSADLGLANTSAVAFPLYTFVERRVVRNVRNATARTWEYQGRCQDGALSPWLTEDETTGSFSPLQLDVFHASYEAYHGPTATTRSAGPPTRGEREMASRNQAFQLSPMGTLVGREFANNEGQFKVFKATVVDYSDPVWRVEYPDGDWEELTRREMDTAIGVASRPSAAT